MRIRNAVATMIWLAAVTVLGAREPIGVVVFDNAGTLEATLRQAVETAREPFRAAKIPTAWSLCRVSKVAHEHCSLPPEGSYLKVLVVPEWKGPRKGREAMGVALTVGGKGGLLSYALSRPAQALAAQTEQPLAVVLGCVMAHEVGHLMGLHHSAAGIMKPSFELRDLLDASTGNLHFTDQAARAMREFGDLMAQAYRSPHFIP